MKKIYESMTNAQLGAHFEAKISTALTALKKESQHQVMFLRLYDTKAASAYLPAQPADFIVGCPCGAFLLEAKASFQKESLASCLSNAVQGHQAAGAKLWDRTGPNQGSLFVFFCAETEHIEIWEGLLVADTFITPGKRLRKETCWLDGDLKELKTLLEGALLWC